MATLIWRRGLRGPSPAISPQDFVDEHDRRLKLSTHKLKPGEEVLPLSVLAKMYPPPKDADDGNASPADHTKLT